jgi:hypothetical protein
VVGIDALLQDRSARSPVAGTAEVVKPLYAQRPSSDERDRGRFYGAVVRRRSRAMGIRDKGLPHQPCPRQNGFAERMIGLIWRRDIDHIVVLTEALAPDLAILWLLLQLIRTHRLLDKDAPVSRPGSEVFGTHRGHRSNSYFRAPPISAQAANMDANKQITANKPA